MTTKASNGYYNLLHCCSTFTHIQWQPTNINYAAKFVLRHPVNSIRNLDMVSPDTTKRKASAKDNGDKFGSFQMPPLECPNCGLNYLR